MPDRGRGGGKDETRNLGWKDYVALFIALVQTVALPIILLVAILLAALVILKLLH